MGNELREATIVGVELILFGLLILIIALFGNYARDAFALKEARNQGMSDIQEYRGIYNLTEGSEIDLVDCDDAFLEAMGKAPNGPDDPKVTIDVSCEEVFTDSSYNFLKAVHLSDIMLLNVVTGDDIVRFASLHPKEYNMYIRIDTDSDNDIILKDALSINEEVLEKEKEDLRRIWDISILSETLGEDVNSYFLCFATYNSILCQYPGIIFVKIPTSELETVWGIELEVEEELHAP